MSFANLKARSSASINKLVQAAEKLSENKSFGDDALWAPTVDKAGNGYAVIRFLPAAEGQDLPFIRYWDHGFKGATGRWYIENSLTSIGQPDPVSELNSKLWNSGVESDKEVVRSRKRRLHYVSNILVISDPANPANDGKVFKYKYGKKIFDKIMDKAQPQFQDEKPIDVFNFWTGANFKLKIRQVEGYRNYDKSEFDAVSPLFGGDDARLEEIYKSLHALNEYLDPKNYKSYTELSKKLAEVLGDEYTAATGADKYESAPAPKVGKVAAPAAEPKADETDDADLPPKPAADEDDDEGSMSYFAKLARQ